MSGNPNKLRRFWQELKRRRVIHVVTVYASAAFVVIELAGNLTGPLHLPPGLSTIVVIVLAVGFPLAVILSWIYDLTGEGWERTRPLDEDGGDAAAREAKVPNAWKIATVASFVVIAGLVTFNIMSTTRWLRSGGIESLAILPFNNYTGDDQMDWVASGMHASLIGDMGKMTGLRVLGETTSKAYKDAKMTATEIADKNHVEAIVEPTLTCYGDMVCIQVKVITTRPEEKVLWVEEYMEDKSQILNLYNRITRRIADELKINLTQQEERLLAESISIDPEAYDAYLHGRVLLDQFNPPSFHAAIDSFQKAKELEPEWAAPYAGIAEVGSYQRQIGIASESDMITMYTNLNKALELDPNSAESHHTNAVIAVWTEFNWEKGENEFLKAIELNPSFERSHSFYAHLLSILRRTDEALYEGKIAEELDPENPFTLGLYESVLRDAGKCQEALYYTEKALAIDPDHPFLRGRLLETYLCLGNYEGAFKEWKRFNYAMWEKYGVAERVEKIFSEDGWDAFMRELIHLNQGVMAEEIQSYLPAALFEKYMIIGEYQKAVDNLVIMYKDNSRSPDYPYFSTQHYYERLKGDPRYLDILRDMNLPVS